MSQSLLSLQRQTATFTELPETKHLSGHLNIDGASADRPSEACSAFLLGLEDRLRGIREPGELARVACELVAVQLDLTQAVMLKLDSYGHCVPVVQTICQDRQFIENDPNFTLADFGTSKAQLEAGQVVRVGDVRLDPRLTSAVVQHGWAARQVLAVAAAPIIDDDRACGLLVGVHAHPRVWCDAGLMLLRHAGPRIWRAMADAEAHLTLQRSERYHRTAVELCSQTFWTARPDGVVVSAGHHFGSPSNLGTEGPSLDWKRTMHPDDLPIVEQRVEQCLRTGENYDIEYRIYDARDRLRWVHAQAKPMRKADGSIDRWFGTVTDISRRKSSEAALKSSEERFVRALAGARVGTWELDLDADKVETSPGYASTFFGRLDGSIRCFADLDNLLHPDDRAASAIELARVVSQARLSGHADYQSEFRTILPNGDIRWLGSIGRYTAEPKTGRNARLSGVLVDMSERRRAELELNATQKRLQDLNADLEAQVRRAIEAREQAQAQLAQSQRLEALGQLAGGIAHDFNNVLQAVMGGLDLLERRADRSDQVRQLAVRTGQAVARGVAITGRLLSFARRGELHAQRVEAGLLLDGLRDLLAPTLGANIALQVISAPGLDAFLADRAQLETVLVNLAVNARHAMPEGGTLVIEARQALVHAGAPLQSGMPPGLRAGSYVRISVQDNGTGMPPDILARACDPFFTTKPAGEGTGLGLAMARGFAEQSGGGLMVSSQLGQGTLVSLWLPGVQAMPASDTEPVPAGSKLAGRSPCVLMVDDDSLVRSSLAGLLVELGCTVIEAESAAVALTFLRANAPVDLVVTDYTMPGMNGAALAAVLRQNYPNLPLLLVTGNVDASLRIDTVGWDPDRIMVLRKPLSASALASAVARLLGTSLPGAPMERR